MFRRFGLMIIVLALAVGGCGEVGEDGTGSGTVSVVSEGETSFTVSVETPDLDFIDVTTKGGQFVELRLDGFDHWGQIGAPALPAIRKLVLLPLGGKVVVNARAQSVETIALTDLVIPNQAPIEKVPGAFARAKFAMDEDAYLADEFAVGRWAAVVEEAMIRNHRVGILEITPVDYNPVSGELTYAHNIEISVEVDGANLDRTYELSDRFDNEIIFGPYRRFILNSGGKWARFKTPSYGADYLIIHASNFYSSGALAQLVTMKSVAGWNVHTEDISAIGSNAQAIWTYINQQYNSMPDLAFVLLVGDTNTIPHVSGTAYDTPATDLYYSCMTPGDYIPDLLIGRLPVQTGISLAQIVNKIDSYEDQQFGDWISTATFMASNDRYTVSEGTHNAVANAFLNPHGYDVNKLYSETYNATTAQVRAAINAGTNYAIYSGHGSETSWADGPPFSQEDVRGLTNSRYPFVCSFACLTGKFQRDECFAETWIREESGASAVIASSVNSYWDEDDWFEKGMFVGMYNFPAQGYPNQTLTAAANLMGKVVVWLKSNHGGGDSQRYFEMYNLFGDPSMDLITY
jgi:gingipain R